MSNLPRQAPEMAAQGRRRAFPQRAAGTLAAAALLQPGWSGAAPLRVFDRAAIQTTEVVDTADGFEVRGQVRDSLGQPVPGLEVQTSDQPGARCATQGPRTDDSGRFCIARRGRLPAGGLNLHTTETAAYAGIEAAVSRRAGALPAAAMSLASSVLRLEGDPTRVAVELEPRSRTSERFDVSLSFSSPDARPSRQLRKGVASAGLPAVFHIAASELGPPGRGRLAARVYATPDAYVEVTADVDVVGEVALSVRPPAQPAEVHGDFALSVTATTAEFPVEGGRVDLFSDDTLLTSSSVASGTSTLRFQVPNSTAPRLVLTLRYVPEDAFHQASVPAELTLELAPAPPYWLLWVVLALGAALWLLRQWWRPARLVPKEPQAPAQLGRLSPMPVPPNTVASHGTGRVVDEHTGAPIARATITLVRPGFREQTRERLAISDPRGHFAVAAEVKVSEGCRWHVEAPGYASLLCPAPADPAVCVRLVTVRRAALQMLRRWLLASGPPWNRPQLSPGEAVRLARQRLRGDVEHWAVDIERVAFGSQAPVEADQLGLESATPPLDR